MSKLIIDKCKTCVWGTKVGWCVLIGEKRMECKSNDFSEYIEYKIKEVIQ